VRRVSRGDVREGAFLWTRGIAARETLRHLEENRIDPDPLLAEAGLSRGQLLQERGGISVASQCRFLELAAAAANDSLFGLRCAAEMDLRGGGILFYFASSSATVAEALENMACYAGTTSEAVRYEISRDKDATIVTSARYRHMTSFAGSGPNSSRWRSFARCAS
jgi:hypothetical protein